jgi:hypothetical protein
VRVGHLRRCHLAQLLHPVVVSAQHLAQTPVSGQDTQHRIWAMQPLHC